jgi:mono/diheme cytochrome c family protein
MVTEEFGLASCQLHLAAGTMVTSLLREDRMRTRVSLAAMLCSLLATTPTGLRAQTPSPRPAGVTGKAIAKGRQLFHGVGDCSSCHGDDGVGTDEGPALATGPWKNGDGSFPWLLHMTRHAGWGARTREDDPRPMRGPTVLDSAQVRRVAAYVWSISRAKAPAASPR